MICCFGELMLRLSPALNQKWIRDARLNVYVAGAELNVARALAAWGYPSRYVTALPQNYMASEIVDSFPHLIDRSGILYKEGRLGVYYLPQGQDLKTAGVIYDRSYTAFSRIEKGEIDWQNVLRGSDWFHFSAITPALHPVMPEVVQEALTVAKQQHIPVSIDLNYRSKLWEKGIDPRDVIPSLVANCEVLMGNIWAVDSLLGIAPRKYPAGLEDREICIAAADEVASKIFDQFSSVQKIAFTFRYSNEDPIHYFATYHTRGHSFVSRALSGTSAKDKVGSGDCFMAGLIHGIRAQKPPQYVIDFAAAAAFGKLFEEGDATRQRIDEIEARFMA